MGIRKILAGIDFGKDSEKVMAYSFFLSKTYDASLHLLYILDYLVTPPAYLLPYIEEERRNAEEKFELLKKGLIASGGKAESEVVVGRLRESFDAAIKHTGSDILVLGFASHVFRRSSSEKLIKGLKVPLFVVRGEKAEAAVHDAVRIRRILCPSDFSAVSRKTLATAGEFAVKFSAHLEVVHVLPDYMVERMKSVHEKTGAVQELRSNAEEQMREFLQSAGSLWPGTVREGEPYAEILTYAKETDADLIVMGARGLGHIEGMLIGSVTDAVLKSSPCPVLVIH